MEFMQVIIKKGLIGCHAAFFLLSFPLYSQVETGAISGYVLDPSESAIPNAVVTLEDSARSYKRTGHSNASGYYEFDALPPADYRLSATAESFAPVTTLPIRIGVDQRARVDLHAKIAGEGTRVEVRAESIIQRDSSELGAVLDLNLINGLPLNERDFLQLALLLPGVAP